MDRTFRGFIAGFVGGVAMNAWNLFDYYVIHITKLRFLDWSSVLLTLGRPKSTLEFVVSLLVHLIWDGFLGICFAHLVQLITSRGVVIKSTLYSLLLWFLFKIAVNLFRVPYLMGTSAQTYIGGMSNLASILIWGLVLGFMMKYLDRRNGGI